MVDASLRLDDPAAARGRAPAIDVRVGTSVLEAHAMVDALSGEAIHTGYQHPAFLAAWLDKVRCRPVFVQMRAAGHGPVLLPLEVCSQGIAGYCGGRHANGNFPLGRPADLAALAQCGPGAVRRALKRAALPASAVILERQHRQWRGLANPFVLRGSVPSPNVALSFSLQGGFDAVLAARSGKRKRKKYRNHLRKLQAMGTVRFHHPVPSQAVTETLDAFLALKAERFRQAGIVNVFGDAPTRAFFHALFGSGVPAFELHALTVGDVPAAIIGCTIHDGRLTVEFGTFDARFAHAGPGEMLFFSAIAHACARKLAVFDFGIGDEPYKRAWCDIETTHVDTALGLTPAGRASAVAQLARSRAVRFVKSHERLWALTKAARKRLAPTG